MKSSFRVLLLGSSEGVYTKPLGSLTLPQLLVQVLRAAAPDARWEGAALPQYQRPNMAERCLDLVSRHRADIVVLMLTGGTLFEEKVSYAVLHRFPWLYPVFWRAAELAKVAAGGGGEGSASPRGLLFRAPRAVARRVLGVAPMVYREPSLRATEEMLRALAALPRVKVICRLAVTNIQQEAQRDAVRAQVAEYNVFVARICSELNIPFFDVIEAVNARGQEYRLLPDRMHVDFETREAVAGIVADYVLGVLETL